MANINPVLFAALEPLGLPVGPVPYRPAEKDCEYITFITADERPADLGDDGFLSEEIAVQVHYFTKASPVKTKRAIKKALFRAGFWVSSTVELYEADTGYRHIVFEADITLPAEV